MADDFEITAETLEKVAAGEETLQNTMGLDEGAIYEIASVGFTCYENNKLDEAETIFRGLLALNPQDSNAWTMLGSIAQLQGNSDDAITNYTHAIELNDDDIAAHTNRGELLLMRGDLEEAGGDFARAIELDPDGMDRSANRARALVVVTSEILNEVKKAHDAGELEMP